MNTLRKQFLSAVVLLAAGVLTLQTSALEPRSGALFVRVIDVGAGLSCVAVLPGGGYLIYDAGNYKDKGAGTFAKIQELIPSGAEVALLVLSHSDADHLGAVNEICDAYHVQNIVHSGLRRDSTTWWEANQAIEVETGTDNCVALSLKEESLPLGQSETFGDASIQWIFGFSAPSEEWVTEYHLSKSERMNVGSIVMKLQFAGKSILFCGDSVGRHIDDPGEVCIAAEKTMVDNAEAVPLQSDVIVAPHHGADNGSSTAFLAAVHPEYVVFSAGHAFRHPRATTVQRYLDAGVHAEHLFRTDRGDNEGWTEWHDADSGTKRDGPGDDDVDVLIGQDGSVQVGYR